MAGCKVRAAMTNAQQPVNVLHLGCTCHNQSDRQEAPVLRMKSCPRCRGDVAEVRDREDQYLSCVQCGFVHYKRSTRREALGVGS